jgi:exosortase
MTKSQPHPVSFAVLFSVCLIVGWRPLVNTFALALHDNAYTHILLILPISAALIFLEWRSLQAKVAWNVRIGSALLATAGLIAFLSVWSRALPSDVQLSIGMFSLVLSWIGAFVLCFGARSSRLVLFPLYFLFGLLPLPQFVMNEIVYLLQEGSAGAANMLFAAFGVPVVRNDLMLTIPGLTVQVAQECSSIRSSSMLLVTTMVLTQLLLRSPWRKALVIGIAVPLSVAKNGLRIFTIAMLGTRVDPGFLTGRLHHQGGILFFMISLLVIFLLLWFLRQGDANAVPSPNAKHA